MSWAVGWDSDWHRDIGYGVPAKCDHPACDADIDRGLAYVCGNEPYGGEHGCGLYFCGEHHADLCERCAVDDDPFEPKPDVAEWIAWKLTDESWRRWRDDNPDEVDRLRSDGAA